MLTFRNPWWLLVIAIIPIALLFWIFLGTFQIIESLLTNENVNTWKIFGFSLATFWTLQLFFTTWSIFKKRLLDKWYGFSVLGIYIPFLYIYFTFYEHLVPRSIPGWMVSDNLMWYAGSFIMPSLVHALFVLVVCFTQRIYRAKAWRNIVAALAVPLLWYALFQLVFPLWHYHDDLTQHVIVITSLLLTVVFLFFLLRWAYLLALKREKYLKKYELVIKIILALAFPVTGLIVNNDMFFDFIFGNFSNPWFFVLAIINGLAVCMPDEDHKYYRLVVFCIRSITFTYIIYFFLVFVPFLPLSVVAIIAFGLGFLMLTPIVLMVFQTKMIVTDFVYLYNNYSRRTINTIFIVSILTIPITVSAVYVKEKRILQRALRHVYNPDYSRLEDAPVNVTALQDILDHIKKTKRRWGQETPFLTSYYNWIVLDNLTLSDNKIEYLEHIFTGKKQAADIVFASNVVNTRNNVKVTDAHTSSVYDDEKKFWKTTVELEITNQNDWQSEFETSFDLPDGAWITDYHLWINGERVEGILAEKKAATWIYQQITSYRQDPGILYYTSGNNISFKVFPFAGNEKRITDFEVIHKDPIQLTIDDQLISLGSPDERHAAKYAETENVVYLSKDYKKNLTPVERKPHYHFIIDCSKNSNGRANLYSDRIKRFMANNQGPASFTMTNAYAKTYDDIEDIYPVLASQDFTGGFLLEHAIKKILLNSYSHPNDHYPVLIVVTDFMKDAIISGNFKDFKFTFPESEHFFQLTHFIELIPHSLISNPAKALKKIPTTFSVAAWPTPQNPVAYVRLDENPSLILKSNGSEPIASHENENGDNWETALAMQGEWMNHVLHPENTSDWLNLVRHSFRSQVMTPVTSFIAVENEAQRKTLLKKQEETLRAPETLDIGEEDRMSEPSIFLLALLLVFVLPFKKIRFALLHV